MAYGTSFLKFSRGIVRQTGTDERSVAGKFFGYGIIKLDATIKETTVYSSEPTQNPVESGVVVTDHIIKKPREFSLVGAFTDTPVGLFGAIESIKDSIGGVVDAVSGLQGKLEESGETRSVVSFNQLVELLEGGALLTVQSGLGEIKDLALKRLHVDQDKDTARAVHFTANFIQLIFTESKTVGVDFDSTGADKADAIN